MVTNKTLKKALEPDVANDVAEKVEENLFGQVKKMSKGISNLQIEKAFKELNDQDINENFVGLFPTNHMNRFIDYNTMFSEKKESIPLLKQTQTVLIKTAPTGGA